MQEYQNIIQVLANYATAPRENKLSAIKVLKNSIIGNRRKKILFAHMNVIPIVVDILNNETDHELLIQAAATLGSFGKSDACDCIQALIKSGSIQSLVKHIVDHQAAKLVETCMRSLKIIYETRVASSDLIFNSTNNVVQIMIHLLAVSSSPSTDSIKEVTASLLARCCQSTRHQNIIANAGGIQALSNLLFSSYPKSQEAALDALSALCEDNIQIGRAIVQQDRVMKQIFNLVKDRRPRIRLLSVKCLANLNRDGVLHDYMSASDITQSVLPVLVKLMSDQGKVREETPSVLASLVTGNEELQKAACDANAVTKLVSFLHDNTLSDTLKENTLSALAELCLIREEGRKLLIESKILPDIIPSIHSTNEHIQRAALICIKGLSRASKQLRASLIEAGIVNNIFKLMNEPSVIIQAEACAIIANIVLDFAPMKRFVYENNGIEKLAVFTKSLDSTLRLNSVFALKNLVYFAEPEVKESVLRHLTIDGIFTLLKDNDLQVHETALNLLRNLIHGDVTAIQDLITNHNRAKLIKELDSRLAFGIHNDVGVGVIIETLYVLCNLSACLNANQKEELMSETVLSHLSHLIHHSNKEIRATAVWTLINLTWKGDMGYEERVRILEQHNFTTQLEELLNDSEVDVRDRAKQCLEQIRTAREEEDSDVEMRFEPTPTSPYSSMEDEL